MKAKYRSRKWAALGCGVLSLTFTYRLTGQTLVNLGTQGRNIDFSNATETRPTKVGTTLPSTCLTGDLFFNTSGTAGQNLFGCASPNTWALIGQNSSGLADPGANGIVKRTATNTTTAVAAPTGALVGTIDTQTLTNKSIDASEINSGTLSGARLPALTGDVTTSPGTTATTLSVVNYTPGSFGDATHSVQMTVDAKGRITAISQIPITNASSSSTSSSSSAMSAGTLSSIPSACSSGALYVATDQPAGQQIYTCSSSNNWTQFISLGGSGSLAFTNGSLDIVPSVVPRLAASNSFAGLNTFSNGIRLASSTTQPACSLSTRGMFWFLSNGSSKDGVQVCVYNGSSYTWISLY
jgi:hypothetical protein